MPEKCLLRWKNKIEYLEQIVLLGMVYIIRHIIKKGNTAKLTLENYICFLKDSNLSYVSYSVSVTHSHTPRRAFPVAILIFFIR